jgi:hypothetical protein
MHMTKADDSGRDGAAVAGAAAGAPEIEITEEMITAATTSLRCHLGERLDGAAYWPEDIAAECLRSALSLASPGN